MTAEPKPIDVYVMTNADGWGTLSLLPPMFARVRFTQRREAYIPVGDPIGLRHLCPEMLELALGEKLEPGVPVRYELRFTRKE